MTPPKQSPEQKALAYVEDLGLNKVYTEAREAYDLLGENTDKLIELRDMRRQLESRKQDYEMSIIEEEREKHPSMSQTQMDKHLKVAFHKDSDLKEYRKHLLKVNYDIDDTESTEHLLKLKINIATSRMQELGGYFQFMAVIKNLNEARKAKEAKDKDPWK